MPPSLAMRSKISEAYSLWSSHLLLREAHTTGAPDLSINASPPSSCPTSLAICLRAVTLSAPVLANSATRAEATILAATLGDAAMSPRSLEKAASSVLTHGAADAHTPVWSLAECTQTALTICGTEEESVTGIAWQHSLGFRV